MEFSLKMHLTINQKIKIMKNNMLLIIVFLLSFSVINAQNSISGIVKDSLTGESLPFAHISLLKSENIIKITNSDFYGYFKMDDLPNGTYNINISFIGYKTCIKENITIPGNDINIEILMIRDPNIVFGEIEIIDYHTPIIADITLSSSVIYEEESYSHNYNTETYDQISENKFKNVLDDPLSTFSIDVDRASYSNVRRFLNNSTMPPPDAVRIEEMINYFDYNYKQPEDEHPFETYLELGECPWNINNKLLMIGIQGESLDEDNIPSCNLVFLVDISGSMYSKNKLPLLKRSFDILIDKLRPQDKISIVVYAGSARCILPSTSGKDKEKIKTAINNLEAGGSTAGGAGIELAYKIAVDNYIKNGNNRVILATDGDFNVGPSSDSEMETLIESNRDKGVYLTILGFGMGNYKDSKMEKLSNKGNGNYAYIDNILEANKIFGHELWGTLYTIAKDVKIQIEFNPSKIKEYRLIGYENRLLNKEDFNDDKKDAGEIGSGHTVTVLYELVISDSDPQNNIVGNLNYQVTNIIDSNDLLTLKIRYKKPGTDTSNLIISRINDEELSSADNSENFILAAAVAEFGMLLKDSGYKGKSDYNHIIKLAQKIQGEDIYGYRSEFINLVRKAKVLSR